MQILKRVSFDIVFQVQNLHFVDIFNVIGSCVFSAQNTITYEVEHDRNENITWSSNFNWILLATDYSFRKFEIRK